MGGKAQSPLLQTPRRGDAGDRPRAKSTATPVPWFHQLRTSPGRRAAPTDRHTTPAAGPNEPLPPSLSPFHPEAGTRPITGLRKNCSRQLISWGQERLQVGHHRQCKWGRALQPVPRATMVKRTHARTHVCSLRASFPIAGLNERSQDSAATSGAGKKKYLEVQSAETKSWLFTRTGLARFIMHAEGMGGGQEEKANTAGILNPAARSLSCTAAKPKHNLPWLPLCLPGLYHIKKRHLLSNIVNHACLDTALACRNPSFEQGEAAPATGIAKRT